MSQLTIRIVHHTMNDEVIIPYPPPITDSHLLSNVILKYGFASAAHIRFDALFASVLDIFTPTQDPTIYLYILMFEKFDIYSVSAPRYNFSVVTPLHIHI